MASLNIYEVLLAAKAVEKECYLPLIINYKDLDCNYKGKVSQGTIFPVRRSQKVDIQKLLTDQLPSNLNFRKMHIYINDLKLLVRDDSSFICACLLHYKSEQKGDVINIYIDYCEPEYFQK